MVKSGSIRCGDVTHVWGGHEARNAYIFLFGKHQGHRRLESLKLKWESNINMDLYEIGHEAVN
jgi:hypothetical protein